MSGKVPYRSLSITRANTRTFYMGWTLLYGYYPRTPVKWSTDAVFKFAAEDEDGLLRIDKTGTYLPEEDLIKFEFLPEDTRDIFKDLSLYYEVDCFLEDKRWTILCGHLDVKYTKLLNTGV